VGRERDGSAVGLNIPGDQPEKRGLSGAVAADQADLVPGGDRRGRAFEEQAPADPVGEVVQMEHGGRDSTGGLRLAKSIAAPDPVRIVAIAVGARARI